MKFRVSNLDQNETSKKPWNLYYHITNADDNTILIRVVNFRASTHNEALKKSLNLLKTSARKTFPNRRYALVTLMPGKWHPFAPVQTEKLLRLKWRYRTRKAILKIKEENLKEYFVQGYGPEAAKQLEKT